MSKTRILITTTSFQDTPGRHHDLLPADQFEIDRARGPLPEAEILRLVGQHDAIICGDDAFTKQVLQKCLPKLRVLSKYGIGVDKIDIPAATELKIPVTFCPGVNHVTVAEHTFGLLLSLTRLIPPQDALIKKGEWKRSTGRELAGKTMGILGLGRIGKEVAKRARAFDMNVCAFDLYWDDAFAKQHGVERKPTGEDVLKASEVVSLHMNLTDENKEWLNASRLAMTKRGAYLINCARGGLVHQGDIAAALKSGQLGGYGADVLDHEPPAPGHPFNEIDNILITPHVGSRTFESVERQAMRATLNIVNYLNGEKDFIQANTF